MGHSICGVVASERRGARIVVCRACTVVETNAAKLTAGSGKYDLGSYHMRLVSPLYSSPPRAAKDPPVNTYTAPNTTPTNTGAPNNTTFITR